MMKRAEKRFDKLMQASSHCCLIFVMIIELAALILICIMWKYNNSYLFSPHC
mgnify:CR=1 FL=1